MYYLRKQYNFRSSENSLYAWDVDRLVESSKKITPHQVSLNEIKELSENYWLGGKGDNPTCRSIVEHFKSITGIDLIFPIILSSNGRVMEGMHRVCKAFMEGNKTITVVQFKHDPEPDYQDIRHPEEFPYEGKGAN